MGMVMVRCTGEGKDQLDDYLNSNGVVRVMIRIMVRANNGKDNGKP